MSKFFCWLGFHKWKEMKTYWKEDNNPLPKSYIYSRYCKRCAKSQTLKHKWIDTEKLGKQLPTSIQ